MANMTQEKKARIVSKVKKVLPKDWRASFKVIDNMELVMTISEIPVEDFESLCYENIEQVKEMMKKGVIERFGTDEVIKKECYFKADLEKFKNQGFNQKLFISSSSTSVEIIKDRASSWWYNFNIQSGVFEKLVNIIAALNSENYDNSDIMSDYHDVGYYVDLNFGRYDKPCKLG